MTCWLSHAHHVLIFDTEVLDNSLLSSCERGIVSYAAQVYTYLFLDWGCESCSYSILNAFYQCNCLTKSSVLRIFNSDFLFNSQCNVSHVYITLRVVNNSTAICNFMWIESVLIELYFNFRYSLILTATCGDNAFTYS